MQLSRQSGFWSEGTGSTRALRQENAWLVRETVTRLQWLEQCKQGGK